MTNKALRVLLAGLLVSSLVPVAAFADTADGNSANVDAMSDESFGGFAGDEFAIGGGVSAFDPYASTSYEPEGYHDEGAVEVTSDGDSWRITDGVPNSIWLEENEGIATLGAFSDVEDGYRATWSAANGVGTYTDRKKPNATGSIIKVPGVKEVGVDISYFNNNKNKAINWKKMKADGITFAIIRIGDGGTNGKGFDDPMFVKNIQGAQAAGIKIGAYLFSRATHRGKGDFSVDNEIKQTRKQLEAAGLTPDDLQLPIYLDLECEAQRKLTKKKGGAKLLGQIAKDWCDAIQEDGYKVGIYANTDWYNNVLTDKMFSEKTMAANQWSRWVARYSWGGTSSNVANTDIWQFTSIGLVSGTPNKYCDMNFSYVEFGDIPETYTVKYHLNGGKMEAANPVSYTQTLKLPTPKRSGYRFDGWYTDKKFKNKVTKLTKKNATLYAKWSRPYTVKYVLNKGKNNKANPTKYSGTLTLKSPTRSGYTFVGWYTDKKFKKKVTKVKGKSVTLYAKWAKNYKITYKLNGGKNAKGNPKTYGGTLTLKNPTRAGYVFKGWYSNKKLTKKVTKLSMTKNRTVYAKWQKLKPGTYKVTARSGLNLRKSASSSARSIKTLRCGKQIKITKIQGGWGRVKGGGWVDLSHVKRV